MYSTALFPVFTARVDEPASGTFVKFDGNHYILTAGHVWEEFERRRVNGIGLTLREGVSHRYAPRRSVFIPFILSHPKKWSRWGPDLALLRVPREIVPTIEAYKAFYDLRKTRIAPPLKAKLRNVDLTTAAEMLSQEKAFLVEIAAIMGTPRDLGVFSSQHAEVKITALLVDYRGKRRLNGKLDYIDFRVKVSSPAPISDFRGMSGGGLWRLLIRRSAEGKDEVLGKSLQGVAFFQTRAKNGCSTICCHGLRSIRALMASAGRRRRHAKVNNLVVS